LSVHCRRLDEKTRENETPVLETVLEFWRKWLGRSRGILDSVRLIASVAIVVGAAVGLTARHKGEVELVRHSTEVLADYRTQYDRALHQYEILATLTASDPQVMAFLSQDHDQADADSLSDHLDAINRIVGASVLYVADRNGIVQASSNWRQNDSFVGIDLSYRPYVRDALKVGEASFFGIGTTSGVPGHYFSHAVQVGGQAVGVVVIKLHVDKLSNPWPDTQDHMLAVDSHGIVYLSSQPDWRFHSFQPLSDEVMAIIHHTRQYDGADLSSLGLTKHASEGDNAWVATMLDKGKDHRFVMVQSAAENGYGSLVLLSELDDVDTAALFQGLIAAMVTVILGFALLLMVQRKRLVQVERAALAAMTEANSRLESEVQQRTRELRDTQDELIHAEKLAAIGQMAAGFNHEINQPLSAIRTLADNARQFLKSGQTDDVTANLERISRMVDRIAAIARDLKKLAFRPAKMNTEISVAECLDTVLMVLDNRIAAQDIAVLTDVSPDIRVQGHVVRLEQILTNLVSNAIDAVAESDIRRIEIRAVRENGHCDLSVKDTGPGIPDDIRDRIFQPFFTTKNCGEGLGLGLSITQTIAREFDGGVIAVNAPDGGAIFTLRMRTVAAYGPAKGMTDDR
jgi:two-component system C4-dicarboxylate transport sensor histidine kinase DctB